MVSPLNISAPGPMGPLRDLARENAGLRRDLAHARATAMTGQAMPAAPASGYRIVRQSGLTSVANDAWTLLSWPTTARNEGTAVTKPNATDLQAGVTGLYIYGLHLHWTTGGVSGPREMRTLLNGNVIDTASERSAEAITLNLGRPVWLAAGDLLAVEARQVSGGPLNIYNLESFGGFSLALIREA